MHYHQQGELVANIASFTNCRDNFSLFWRRDMEARNRVPHRSLPCNRQRPCIRPSQFVAEQ
jgi:hypothetical protein